MKHSGGLKHFVRENLFVLGVAAAWLVMVWGFVLAGQTWFKEPLSLSAWAGDWDGGWYRSIVEYGYYSGPLDGQANVAFFPLLPALTWLVSKVTLLPTVWAGLLVSSVSFAAALVVLWHMVRRFFAPPVARWTLLLLAFNPFSLYFGMFYTESLFLLLAVSTFWFIYEKQWWWAAFFAGLATATRSVGVAVAIAVVAGWILQLVRKPIAKPVKPGWRTLGAPIKKIEAPRRSWTPRLLQAPLLIGLSFSGLVAFAVYLWWHTGDPFAFSTVQQFWPGREGSNIGNELVYLWEHRVINMEYLVTAMWFVAAVLVCIGVVLVLRMRQWLLALYSAIALGLPILFGTFTSMNRYALVVFPIFIAAAVLMQKWPAWLRIALLVVSVLCLGVITILMVDPRDIFIA